MSVQRAIVMDGTSVRVVHDRPIPRLRPGYLLVKVHAVALNPTDFKAIDSRNRPDLLAGCDYAGTVEKLGSGYEKVWKVGDRICGSTFGGNPKQPEDGAWAEYIVVKADNALRIPQGMAMEEAATLGIGFQTCGQGLFMSMGLDLPREDTTQHHEREIVLIYGGSGATGSLGIQYAKLAGYIVVTTCSPRNFQLVKSLGADEVLDYNDPGATEKIKAYCNHELRYVWDTMSKDSTAEFCAKVVSPGGVYRCLLPLNFPRDDVSYDFTIASSAFGEPVDRSPLYEKEDTSEEFEFSKQFAAITERLLADGKLKVHRPRVEQTGFKGVLEGLDLLRGEKVSGQKLVYTL